MRQGKQPGRIFDLHRLALAAARCPHVGKILCPRQTGAYRLRYEQKHWVAQRDACKFDRVCLRKHYRQRIKQLNKWAKKFELNL
jgi:hypothetical protein